MNSIRGNLILRLIAGLVILVGGAGLGLYLFAREAFISQFDTALASKAHAMSQLVQQKEHGGVELDYSDDFMPEFDRKKYGEYFQVWLSNGSTFARSKSLGTKDLVRRTGTLEKPVIWNVKLPDGRKGRAVGISFVPPPDVETEAGENPAEHKVYSTEKASIVIARSRAPLDRTLATMLTIILGACILIPMGAVFVVTISVRGGLRPLGQVGDMAAHINAESLGGRFPVDRMPEELRPICGRLNDLLSRLEAAFVRERRFSSDVSHELRTPIAELRGFIELMKKWPEDRALVAKSCSEALDVTLQMESLCSALLMMTRAETGQYKVARQTVDLMEAIEEAWRPFENQAARKNLAVDLECRQSREIQADRTILRSIFRNLFSNAVEYTERGGTVRCTVGERDGRIRIALVNSARNLVEEDIKHMFEPFWRKDEARADSVHSGLGLALAASFCRLLDIELRAQLVTDGELEVSLLFADPVHNNERNFVGDVSLAET